MRAAQHMHSAKSITAIGGMAVILVLFVVLVVLAGVAQTIQFGKYLASASPGAFSRGK
jgi:hypothetical protein